MAALLAMPGLAGTALAQEADLVMSKTAPGSAAADTDIVYNLVMTNAGPDPSVNATVTDTLPADVTFVSISPSAGCTTPAVGSGGTVSCTTASLAPLDSVSYNLTVHIAAATPPGTFISNTATASSPTTPDSTPENDSATASTLVSGGASADLLMSKAGPDTVQPGQNIVYTLTAQNVGPDAAASVSMTDTLPAGLTFVSMPTPAGWSCTTPAVGSGGAVNCTIASFPSGGNAVFTLTVHVPGGTADGTLLENSATISSTTSDPNAANNTAFFGTLVVAAAPDFAIAKSHSGNATQGQTGFIYTIVVSNTGTVASSGIVTVTDALPAGMTATAMSGPGWSCTLATTTCTRSDALGPAGSYPAITLTVNVSLSAPPTVINSATVSNAGDTNPTNDTANDTTTVTTIGPDLTIAKTHSGNARQGQTGFNYTITVSNVGAGVTSGTVTVTDTVPAGMTATAISGAGWSCTLGATPTCTRSDALAPGNAYPAITLTVSVASNAAATLTNTATVSGGGDTNPANNSASDATTVAAVGPDLAIAKTHSGNAKQGQSGFVYTITVRNVGTAPTSGTVTVVDTLPSSMTATAISGSGWSCVVSATPTCSRADALAAGGVYPVITLTVTVGGNGPSSVTNTATVSGGGDINATNNTANDATTVVARRDPSKDPEVVGLINAQIATAERFANAQMMNVNQRLETLHEDGYGEDHQGIASGTPNAYVADGFADLPGASSYADANRPASPSKKVFDQVLKAEPMPTRAPPPAARRDYSFWTSGYVNFGSSNDVIPGSGFGFTTSGVSVGADYRFTPQLTAGLGIGYGRDRTRIGLNGTESRAETYSVTAYESYRPWRHVFVDGLLGFGTLRFNSLRFVTDSAGFAFGNRNGAEWFGSLSAGYEYRKDQLLLSPYGRLKAVWLTLDPFTEWGDPFGSLVFAKQNVETYTGVLGLRGKYDILMDWGVVSPRFRVEYNHAIQNGGVAALGFADWIGGPTYFVPGIATTSDFATLGLGVDVKLPSATFVNFDYQTMINAFDTRSHMFQLKAGRRF